MIYIKITFVCNKFTQKKFLLKKKDLYLVIINIKLIKMILSNNIQQKFIEF